MKKVLISLKHTKATDENLTLWMPNNSGYTCSFSSAGRYDVIEPGYHDSVDTLPITVFDAVESSIDDDEYGTVIPNDDFTRDLLGLKIEGNKLVRK